MGLVPHAVEIELAPQGVADANDCKRGQAPREACGRAFASVPTHGMLAGVARQFRDDHPGAIIAPGFGTIV